MPGPTHRHFRRRKRRFDNQPEPPRNHEPFKLRIHRSLRPVFERIGIPEPQPFIPDPYQVEALEKLRSSDVLVTAPTGAGKTYIATQAIEEVFRGGGKSWYASPLKALSNAKYEEFSQLFGQSNVGILTGDRKENVLAPVIVGTTEILRNQLYDSMHQGEDLEVDLVVLDEAHYLGDADRGVVWEEVLIYLPSRVKILLLSATIRNAAEICKWMQWLRSTPCEWVTSSQRPVPLYPLFLFPDGELSPLSTRGGMVNKIRTIDRKSFSRNELPDVSRLMETLREANLLPAIFFLKSRSDCEKSVEMCNRGSPRVIRENDDQFNSRLDELLDRYPFLRKHQNLGILRQSRVGAHHGGQLPHWKLLLEKLMQEGLLEAIFSTSTVAAGVNFPARTVVIPQSDRFNGKEFQELTATDLLQMTGRAGRRGMDEIGFVLVVPGPFQNPELIHDLLRSSPDIIQSQIRVNFSMVLNLLLSHTPKEIKALFGSSLATHQNMSSEAQTAAQYERARRDLDQWLVDMACGDAEQLVRVRPRFEKLLEQLQQARKIHRRKGRQEVQWELFEHGRIFYSRRGTPYIEVGEPDMDEQSVEAVRLAPPLKFRRGNIRTVSMAFHRVKRIAEKLDDMPEADDRRGWEDLAATLSEDRGYRFRSAPGGDARAFHDPDTERLIAEIESLPCGRCDLYGACHKSDSHPFSWAMRAYFESVEKVQTVQEQLWRSFQKLFRILHEEGYVDEAGRLTGDGHWACKLRLDQPLLISEGIRRRVFPEDDPELLAALIAPFVMDRDRPGEAGLARLIWRYPDLASPYYSMIQKLQPLLTRLESEGFHMPPLPFWATATVYYWAKGEPWGIVKELTGMDEGDLAMAILRTADHLRQIESLRESHPRLAASASKAIDLILREPVLVE